MNPFLFFRYVLLADSRLAAAHARQLPDARPRGIEIAVDIGVDHARLAARDALAHRIGKLGSAADAHSGNPAIRMTNHPHREFVYRGAFEMGRHVIGYEVQKILAAVDWLEQSSGGKAATHRIGVMGHTGTEQELSSFPGRTSP